MKINYKNAEGKIIELEVSEEVGTFYLESVEVEKSNDRKNTRRDRHTSLSEFTYEDARYFSDGTDLEADLIENETINHAMSSLSKRQQYLIKKCCIDGWSYTDLSKLEGVTDGAIRHAVERAKKKLRNIFS